MVYSSFRTGAWTFDDDPGFTDKDYPDYVPSTADPSELELRIQVGGAWSTAWAFSGTAHTLNAGATVQAGTLGLSAGSVYKLALWGKNGGFDVGRISGYGAASYSWPTLPATADGGTPTYDSFNRYGTALFYCKEELDAPRGPTPGLYDRQGKDAGNSRSTVVWRANMQHRGTALRYRFGAKWPYNFTLMLTYNGGSVAGTASSGGGWISSGAGGSVVPWLFHEGTANVGTIGLTVGSWYTLNLGAFTDPHYDTGNVALDYAFETEGEPSAAITAQRWTHADLVRGSSLPVTNGGFDSDVTGWTANVSTLASIAGGQSGNCLQVTNSAVAYGFAYQSLATEIGRAIEIRVWHKNGTATGGILIGTSVGAGDLHNSGALNDADWTQRTITVTPTGTTTYLSLSLATTVAGATTLFDMISCTPLGRLADINTDLTALKALCDNHHQILCPDLTAGTPGWISNDSPGDLRFIRQRAQAPWEMSGSPGTVKWGNADSPNQQALGAVTAGTVDLRGLNDCGFGTTYWFQPREKFRYAFET